MIPVSIIDVHGGDFKTGQRSNLVGDQYLLMVRKDKWFREKIPLKDVASVEEQNSQSVQRLSGVAGFAAVGALALGPVGLLAGLLGGKGTDITFLCTLKDGRRFLATSSSAAFNRLKGGIL